MSDATPNSEPKQLGRAASWGLLGATLVGAYIAWPVVPFIFAHAMGTAVVAAAVGATAYVKKDKLEGFKSAISKTVSTYKQAFSKIGSDWKALKGWGKTQAAARDAAKAAAPANDDASPSKLAGAESKTAFNGAQVKVTAKPAVEKKPSAKISGLNR